MSTAGKKGERPPQGEPKARPRPADAREGPGRMTRIIASIALLLHVVVLFLYPLANSRTSTTVREIAQSPLLRWYPDIMYLNHGYGFFGPDPGPGILLEYEVRDNAGEIVSEGKFPDADRIWPRLRYHRYKMLADQIESIQFDPNIAEQRKRFMLERYARQLIRQHGGDSATVTQILHEIVPLEVWLGNEEQGVEGKPLDDKSTYKQLMQVRQTKADVELADQQLLSSDGDDEESTPEAISPGAL